MTEKHIRLLDCSLRDGGHLTQGFFGKDVIKDIISKLVDSHIDFIEVGFLWDQHYGEDVARYYSINDVKRILPEKKGKTTFVLMADFIDLKHLEPCDGTIEIIRLSFKRHRLKWALDTGKILKEKGYKIFINPVNCNVYSDEQYLDLIQHVNELNPYGFTIVDTFGVMRVRDLTYRYSIVEKNLDKKIVIGLHLHENLGLAYSLAQQFLQIADPKRKLVIDGSLLGMGRAPGNLCIEQIMDYLNTEQGTKYNLKSIYDAIDDYIVPIKSKAPWGYAVPYAISAKYNLHRTYAEYLMKKWKLKTSDIEHLLSRVSTKEAELFNEKYIEQLYRKYMAVNCDDIESINLLKHNCKNKKILLIAPGRSINNNPLIKEYQQKHKCLTIGIHCVINDIKLDYIFFSNIKRYEALYNEINNRPTILTSNLLHYKIDNKKYIVKFSRVVWHGENYNEDSVLMVLNLLKAIGISEITIAGFDGVISGKGDFYIETLSRNDRPVEYSEKIKQVLIKEYLNMNILFLTPSYYDDYKEKKNEQK